MVRVGAFPIAGRGPVLTSLLASLSALPWGQEAARVYRRLRAQQESIGRTIGNMDLMIAAHAISAGAILVTNDQPFTRVKATLPLINWATDL